MTVRAVAKGGGEDGRDALKLIVIAIECECHQISTLDYRKGFHPSSQRIENPTTDLEKLLRSGKRRSQTAVALLRVRCSKYEKHQV